MIITGKIHLFGDHVDTDQIIPGRYLGFTDRAVLGPGCFADVAPGFSERVSPGDVLVAGENFGCGSSREHAPLAIAATGIGCIVAKSFSRIFYRSAINLGLPVVTSIDSVEAAVDGNRITVDLIANVITVGENSTFSFAALQKDVLAIIAAGGLVPFMTRRLASTNAGNPIGS